MSLSARLSPNAATSVPECPGCKNVPITAIADILHRVVVIFSVVKQTRADISVRLGTCRKLALGLALCPGFVVIATAPWGQTIAKMPPVGAGPQLARCVQPMLSQRVKAQGVVRTACK